MESAITIVCAVLGSAGLFTLIQFLITRHDRKKDRISVVEQQLNNQAEQLKRQEKDSCRTQLLILMADYPKEVSEIMKIGKHYFEDLQADWYLTSLFQKYLEREEITPPLWFKGEK